MHCRKRRLNSLISYPLLAEVFLRINFHPSLNYHYYFLLLKKNSIQALVLECVEMGRNVWLLLNVKEQLQHIRGCMEINAMKHDGLLAMKKHKSTVGCWVVPEPDSTSSDSAQCLYCNCYLCLERCAQLQHGWQWNVFDISIGVWANLWKHCCCRFFQQPLSIKSLHYIIMLM